MESHCVILPMHLTSFLINFLKINYILFCSNNNFFYIKFERSSANLFYSYVVDFQYKTNNTFALWLSFYAYLSSAFGEEFVKSHVIY